MAVNALPVARLQVAGPTLYSTDRACVIPCEPKTLASSWSDLLRASCGSNNYPDRLCSRTASIQIGAARGQSGHCICRIGACQFSLMQRLELTSAHRATVAELLSQAYSKSILSLVTPNPSWPQPYLLWLRRASYAAPSGRRPPPTLHFVDNAGVASVGRLVLHASVHFRSFKICSLSARATCTPSRIASGFSPSTARTSARKASTARRSWASPFAPSPNITLNCRSLLLR